MTNGTTSPWTPELSDEAVKLWMEGWSASRIAKKFKMSRNTVLGKLDRLGYLKRRHFVEKHNKRTLEPRPITLPKVSV